MRMNASMTQNANGNNIQSVFFIVAVVMMIYLCLIVTMDTSSRLHSWQPTHYDFVMNGVLCSASIGMCMIIVLSPISQLASFCFGSTFLLHSLTHLWLIVVSPVFGAVLLGFTDFADIVARVDLMQTLCVRRALVITNTLFAVVFVPILFVFAFVKLAHVFDLLAVGTSLCYDLFSHFRSFQREWSEPCTGHRPVHGSLYSLRELDLCQGAF